MLNYPKNFKFGAVLYDFTCDPCLLALLEQFGNPPIIAMTAFSNPPYTGAVVGSHKYPAYVPHYRLYYDTDMSFYERVHNVAAYAAFNM